MAEIIKDPGLSEAERGVLEVLAMADKGVHTPDNVARVLSFERGRPTTWQAVTRAAGALARIGLAHRRTVGKMTYYEITADGRAELEVQRVSARLAAEAQAKGITCGDPDCYDEEHRA